MSEIVSPAAEKYDSLQSMATETAETPCGEYNIYFVVDPANLDKPYGTSVYFTKVGDAE